MRFTFLVYNYQKKNIENIQTEKLDLLSNHEDQQNDCHDEKQNIETSFLPLIILIIRLPFVYYPKLSSKFWVYGLYLDDKKQSRLKM